MSKISPIALFVLVSLSISGLYEVCTSIKIENSLNKLTTKNYFKGQNDHRRKANQIKTCKKLKIYRLIDQ